MMKRSARMMGLILVAMFLGGCETPRFQTIRILDKPDQVVALQAMSDPYGGKGFDHPVSLSNEEMLRILQGVRVERSRLGNSQHAAFSETEIRVFAPYIGKGLEKATNEEIVTYFETAQLDEQQPTTSGGLYVAGGNLYVVLQFFSENPSLAG